MPDRGVEEGPERPGHPGGQQKGGGEEQADVPQPLRLGEENKAQVQQRGEQIAPGAEALGQRGQQKAQELSLIHI